MTYREHLATLRLFEERSYGDGVTRHVRRVDDRIELVSFVTRDGSAPLGIQVWIDGLPQDVSAISERPRSAA